MPEREPALRGGVTRIAAGSRSPARLRLLLTCEHGGNRVPDRYASLFRGVRGTTALLHSHRGWDPGALDLARFLSSELKASGLDAPLRFTRTTRLLVDPNRSIGSGTLFSEITGGLSEGEKRRILRRYYHRHRGGVEARLQEWIGAGETVLHLGIHTFTPQWEGVERTVDLGILFDPRRPLEAHFAAKWRERLRAELPELRIRANAPYRGTDDGLTTELRRRLPESRYLGLELELSQGIATDPLRRTPIFRGILAALRAGFTPPETA